MGVKYFSHDYIWKISILELSYMLKTVYKPEITWSRTKAKWAMAWRKYRRAFRLWPVDRYENIPGERETLHWGGHGTWAFSKSDNWSQRSTLTWEQWGPRLRGLVVSAHPLESMEWWNLRAYIHFTCFIPRHRLYLWLPSHNSQDNRKDCICRLVI